MKKLALSYFEPSAPSVVAVDHPLIRKKRSPISRLHGSHKQNGMKTEQKRNGRKTERTEDGARMPFRENAYTVERSFDDRRT